MQIKEVNSLPHIEFVHILHRTAVFDLLRSGLQVSSNCASDPFEPALAPYLAEEGRTKQTKRR